MKNQGHLNRRKRVENVWKRIYNAYYEDNRPVKEILEEFKNPKTGRPYSRSHFYFILDQVKESLKN
jgi:hypothetical protein